MSQENNSKNPKHAGEETSKVIRFLTGKGFYIVLILCLSAIGISGYFFARNNSGSFSDPLSDGDSLSEPAYVAPLEEALLDRDAADYLDEGQTVMAEDLMEQAESAMNEQSLDEAAQAQAAAVADRLVIWPLKGEVSKAYSVEALAYSETMADWRTHHGLDIGAELGTKVMAVSGGTVTQIYEDEFLGTTLVIDHAGGIRSSYSNLMASPTVSVGDTVSAGDVIGAVGATALGEIGQAPHLHLEIFRDGVQIDPLDYLP